MASIFETAKLKFEVLASGNFRVETKDIEDYVNRNLSPRRPFRITCWNGGPQKIYEDEYYELNPRLKRIVNDSLDSGVISFRHLRALVRKLIYEKRIPRGCYWVNESRVKDEKHIWIEY